MKKKHKNSNKNASALVSQLHLCMYHCFENHQKEEEKKKIEAKRT